MTDADGGAAAAAAAAVARAVASLETGGFDDLRSLGLPVELGALCILMEQSEAEGRVGAPGAVIKDARSGARPFELWQLTELFSDCAAAAGEGGVDALKTHAYLAVGCSPAHARAIGDGAWAQLASVLARAPRQAALLSPSLPPAHAVERARALRAEHGLPVEGAAMDECAAWLRQARRSG